MSSDLKALISAHLSTLNKIYPRLTPESLKIMFTTKYYESLINNTEINV